MKHSHETLAGTLVISAVIVAGFWYASDPDFQHWSDTGFSTGLKESKLSQISVNRIDWSTDGHTLLAMFRGEEGSEACLALHKLGPAGDRIQVDSLGDSVCTAALAPDGRHILIGSYEGRLWWFEPQSFDVCSPLVELPNKTSFSAIVICSDGCTIAAATSAGSIFVCDPYRQTTRVLESGRASTIFDLRFSRDGTRLVATQNNGPIIIWSVATGEILQRFTGHEQVMTVAEFLPDRSRLISAGMDDAVVIWDIDSGREVWRGEFGLCGIRSLAVSPDGTTAAWGGYSHKVVVWDLERGRKKFEIATSAPQIFHLRFSPDGTTLAVAGWAPVIRLFDVRTAAELNSIAAASPQTM